MKIPALQPHIVASDIAPERLAGNPQLTDREKIAEASRQFESILLKQILDNTQKTVIKSKFSDDSTAAGIYHDMVTSQLADSLSKSGAFGLAKTFEQQLNRPPASLPKAGQETPAPSVLGAHPAVVAHSELSYKKTLSTAAHPVAQTLKPLHERTLTKSH